MKIEHIAIWTQDLKRLREFYVRYFHALAGPEYANPKKGYRSYFLAFDSGARIEIASLTELNPRPENEPHTGFAHFAFSTGSEAEVDRLTEQLRLDGVPVLDGPRRTGDGYYESVVLDPDGNRVEISV